jgi:hypothetical protein
MRNIEMAGKQKSLVKGSRSKKLKKGKKKRKKEKLSSKTCSKDCLQQSKRITSPTFERNIIKIHYLFLVDSSPLERVLLTIFHIY